MIDQEKLNRFHKAVRQTRKQIGAKKLSAVSSLEMLFEKFDPKPKQRNKTKLEEKEK